MHISHLPFILRGSCSILLLLGITLSAVSAPPSLVERLGYPQDAKLLIINADDFGMNHATNTATIKALTKGVVTSSTIMTPCPWFLETVRFAKKNPKADLGVHLTLTSEWKQYKWAPILGAATVPSLCDENGYLYPSVPMVYLSAKPEELRRELCAQIDRALKAGIDVTHLDSHMGTLHYAPGYHKMYVQIAKEYNLPCRIVGHDIMDRYAFGYWIDYADELGVLHPDILVTDGPRRRRKTAAYWTKQIESLRPGKVTEFLTHCAGSTTEMWATTSSTLRRVADTDFFTEDSTRALLKEQNVTLISYRELRALQRNK